MIKIENLCKEYDGKVILDRINLEITHGNFWIFMGPSGSGKSTFLSIISGLARPTSGAVFYNELNIAKLPEDELGKFRNRKIGFVFQRFNLLENLTVYENMLPPLIINEKPFSKDEVFKVLKKFEIDRFADTKVRKLSGGEQQRVALARALVNDPEVLIADEPTANLDPRLKYEVIDLFKQINSEGKTIIIATHDEVLTKANGVKIAKMSNGKLVS